MKAYTSDPAVREKQSAYVTENYVNHPEIKTKISEAAKARFAADPSLAKASSDRMKAMYAAMTPEQKKQFLANTRVGKFNKSEQRLLKLLPETWKFNGDGSGVVLTMPSGKCRIPDFVPVDFEHNRAVIEFFGEYWHPASHEASTIADYRSIGVRCLVVWFRSFKRDPVITAANVASFLAGCVVTVPEAHSTKTVSRGSSDRTTINTRISEGMKEAWANRDPKELASFSQRQAETALEHYKKNPVGEAGKKQRSDSAKAFFASMTPAQREIERARKSKNASASNKAFRKLKLFLWHSPAQVRFVAAYDLDGAVAVVSPVELAGLESLPPFSGVSSPAAWVWAHSGSLPKDFIAVLRGKWGRRYETVNLSHGRTAPSSAPPV